MSDQGRRRSWNSAPLPASLSDWMGLRWRRRNEARSKHKAPSPLGDLISLAAPEVKQEEPDTPLSRDVWLRIVGPRIADRSEPHHVEGSGVLVVHVADSVWAQELSLLSSMILPRLRALGLDVRTLRFAVRRVLAPRRSAPLVERRTVAQPRALPSDLQEEIDRIDDPALRAVVTRAAAASLAQAEMMEQMDQVRRIKERALTPPSSDETQGGRKGY